MPKGTDSPKMQIETPALAPGTSHRAEGTREPVGISIPQRRAEVPRHQHHGRAGCPLSSPGHCHGSAVAATSLSHTLQSKTRARRNK